jgi:hypothetical protein
MTMAVILLIIAFTGIMHKKIVEDEIYKWILLWGSVALYFLIVSKVTVYIVDRYFFPIYGVLILLFSGTLYLGLDKGYSRITGKTRGKIEVFVVLSIILLITTFKNFRTSFYYLYRSTQPLLDMAAEHSDADCIFVYNGVIQITPAMLEVSNYASVTFEPFYEMDGLKDITLDTDNGLMVVVGQDCDFEYIKNYIGSLYPELNAFEYCGSHSYTSTYYFHNE